MRDIRLALLTGIDIPIPECQLTIHQPSLKEIAFLGEDTFFMGVQCITVNKTMFVEGGAEGDKDDLNDLNNFQIFMAMMIDKRLADKRSSIKQVLDLLFPLYKCQCTPNSLLFTKKSNQNESDGKAASVFVDDSNFEFLQEMVRAVCCVNSGPMDKQAFNPANEQARKIAEKLMKARAKVAKEKSKDNNSVFVSYISILSIGLQMPMTVFQSYTMAMLFDSIERFSLHLSWDIDIRSRLAGGKPEKEPDNWMKNLHPN